MFCFEANAPDSDRNDLLSELEVMKKLKPHPHVIKLMGCITKSGKANLMRHYYIPNYSPRSNIIIPDSPQCGELLAQDIAQKKVICC